MPTGYLVGAFDVIDVRDLDVINQLREAGCRVVVGVLTDADVMQRSGREPLIPLDERLELVRHLRGVDSSIPHESMAAASRVDWTTFVVDDEPVPSGVNAPSLLTPRCESRSGVRRFASTGSISQAVA